MMESARLHLVAALGAVGIPERYIQQEVGYAQGFPTSWAAFLRLQNGRLERSGARVRIEDNQTTRLLWKGTGTLQLDLFAPSEAELQQAIHGLLTWLFDHSHINTGASGLHMELPTEGISFTFQIDDGESVLQMTNGVRLSIPVEIGLTRDTAWVPITVELEGEIVGGGP
jgi:hypothetical protein